MGSRRTSDLVTGWLDVEPQSQRENVLFAIGALVVFWALLNRTTLGFEVRAVGYNPEAARYGGINVKRNYFLALAISGAFAGLGGAMDILGWEFHLATSDILVSNIGFRGALARRSGASVCGLLQIFS